MAAHSTDPSVEQAKVEIRKVASRLAAYQAKFDRSEDPRAVFTCAYLAITNIIEHGIGEPGIVDPAWVAALDVAFAGHFFQAMDDYDSKKPVPEAWKTVLEAICEHRCAPLEDLLFGMTAHIVNDLPNALLDVGMTDANGVSHIHDFHFMNDVLGHAIQTIENDVIRRYNPILHPLERLARTLLGASYDILLTNYGIRISRAVAWYNTERLNDPLSTAAARDSMTEATRICVRDIRENPVWFLRIVLGGFRALMLAFRRWPK